MKSIFSTRMHMRVGCAVVGVGTFLTFAGCGGGGSVLSTPVVTRSGTVQYISLEGGFYGLVADDGTKYDPNNLPSSFAQDGLRVKFTFREASSGVAYHQWGIFVDIQTISRL